MGQGESSPKRQCVDHEGHPHHNDSSSNSSNVSTNTTHNTNTNQKTEDCWLPNGPSISGRSSCSDAVAGGTNVEVVVDGDEADEISDDEYEEEEDDENEVEEEAEKKDKEDEEVNVDNAEDNEEDAPSASSKVASDLKQPQHKLFDPDSRESNDIKQYGDCISSQFKGMTSLGVTSHGSMRDQDGAAPRIKTEIPESTTEEKMDDECEGKSEVTSPEAPSAPPAVDVVKTEIDQDSIVSPGTTESAHEDWQRARADKLRSEEERFNKCKVVCPEPYRGAILERNSETEKAAGIGLERGSSSHFSAPQPMRTSREAEERAFLQARYAALSSSHHGPPDMQHPLHLRNRNYLSLPHPSLGLYPHPGTSGSSSAAASPHPLSSLPSPNLAALFFPSPSGGIPDPGSSLSAANLPYYNPFMQYLSQMGGELPGAPPDALLRLSHQRSARPGPYLTNDDVPVPNPLFNPRDREHFDRSPATASFVMPFAQSENSPAAVAAAVEMEAAAAAAAAAASGSTVPIFQAKSNPESREVQMTSSDGLRQPSMPSSASSLSSSSSAQLSLTSTSPSSSSLSLSCHPGRQFFRHSASHDSLSPRNEWPATRSHLLIQNSFGRHGGRTSDLTHSPLRHTDQSQILANKHDYKSHGRFHTSPVHAKCDSYSKIYRPAISPHKTKNRHEPGSIPINVKDYNNSSYPDTTLKQTVSADNKNRDNNNTTVVKEKKRSYDISSLIQTDDKKDDDDDDDINNDDDDDNVKDKDTNSHRQSPVNFGAISQIDDPKLPFDTKSSSVHQHHHFHHHFFRQHYNVTPSSDGRHRKLGGISRQLLETSKDFGAKTSVVSSPTSSSFLAEEKTSPAAIGLVDGEDKERRGQGHEKACGSQIRHMQQMLNCLEPSAKRRDELMCAKQML